MPEIHQLKKVNREIYEYAAQLVNLKRADRTEAALAGLPHLEEIAENIVRLLNTVQAMAEAA